MGGIDDFSLRIDTGSIRSIPYDSGINTYRYAISRIVAKPGLCHSKVAGSGYNAVVTLMVGVSDGLYPFDTRQLLFEMVSIRSSTLLLILVSQHLFTSV